MGLWAASYHMLSITINLLAARAVVKVRLSSEWQCVDLHISGEMHPGSLNQEENGFRFSLWQEKDGECLLMRFFSRACVQTDIENQKEDAGLPFRRIRVIVEMNDCKIKT